MITIEEFNTNLATKLIKYDLNVYFNTVHSKFYNNVDISFMDYFLSLIPKKNEFCVDHQKLIEFGIIKENKDNTNIKNCITNEKYNFKENIDYIILTPERSGVKRVGRGGSNGNAKHYNMKPKVFKKLLMRSKNENKYADYYLLLEEIFYYYREYQNHYQTVLLSMKDDNIDRLNKKVDEQSRKIDELLGYAQDTKDELDDLNDKFNDLNEKVDDIKDSFEETASRSVPDPINDCDKSEFVLLQSKILPNEFSFMRGIQSYNDVKLNKKYSANYNIIKREYNANPVQLFRTLKDTVKEQYKLEKSIIQANKKLKNKRELYKQLEKIKFNGTKIILNDFTLNDLLDKIKEVSVMKYKEYTDVTEETP